MNPGVFIFIGIMIFIILCAIAIYKISVWLENKNRIAPPHQPNTYDDIEEEPAVSFQPGLGSTVDVSFADSYFSGDATEGH